MSEEEIKEIAKELLFMPRNELIKLLISVQQENQQLKEEKDKITKMYQNAYKYSQEMESKYIKVLLMK